MEKLGEGHTFGEERGSDFRDQFRGWDQLLLFFLSHIPQKEKQIKADQSRSNLHKPRRSSLALVPMSLGDMNAVVCDNGTGFVKVGFQDDGFLGEERIEEEESSVGLSRGGGGGAS